MKSMLSQRPFVMLIGVMLLLFAQARTVAAGAPTRVPVPAHPGTISGVCSFDVFVDILSNNEYATIFTDSAGNVTEVLITGELKISLTNLSNGKSIDLNVSGPGRFLFNPDGSSTQFVYGPALEFLPPGVLPTFPRLFFGTGQEVFQFDSDGNLTDAQIVGHVVDLCEVLADP